MNEKPLVIYHNNCADGFTAAWAVREFFEGDIEALGATYGTPPPDTMGRDVILVDFSYPRDVLLDIARSASSVLVLDHHKSAEEDLRDDPVTAPAWPLIRMDRWKDSVDLLRWNTYQVCDRRDQINTTRGASIFAYFDMNRSGAGIAWDFFHPGKPRPQLIDHVEDRDLWRFALPNTREIQAAVFSYPYTFEAWDSLMERDPRDLAIEGAGIDRKHMKDIVEIVAVCARRMVIAGHDVPVASLPYTMASDAGHMMSESEPFAACYWDTPTLRQFSLRSRDEGLDVAAIAQQFGGGGHRNAAGFRVPRDHELAQA